MLANECRGRDATGIAYVEGSGVTIRKTAEKASEFIKGKEEIFAAASEGRFAMMHTRFKTKGSEKQSENNHPVVGYGWVVTHNGGVTNDDDLFIKYPEERVAAVDTIAINLALSKEGLRGIPMLAGAATFSAWQPADPDNLVLARVGHNDVYLFKPYPDLFVWSSEFSVAALLARETVGRLPLVNMTPLPENTVLVFKPETVETFQVKRKQYYNTSAARRPITAVTGSTIPTRSSAIERPSGRRVTAGRGVEYANLEYDLAPFKDKQQKPQPIFAQVFLPTPDRPKDLLDWTVKTPGTKFLSTPYGTWLADITKTPSVWFKPHRRIRKWQEEWYFPWWDEKNDVPRHALDNELPLERLTFEDTGLPKVYAGKRHVYMCPWCGVSDSKWMWEGWDRKCTWCTIRARVPLADDYVWKALGT